MTDPIAPADPDLVDRIFDYLRDVPGFAAAVPAADELKLKAAVRAEFAGDRARIGPRTESARQLIASQVLMLFNGRNATEVGRRLGIGRATVYRILKQSGRTPPPLPSSKNSPISGRNETAPRVASTASNNPDQIEPLP